MRDHRGERLNKQCSEGGTERRYLCFQSFFLYNNRKNKENNKHVLTLQGLYRVHTVPLDLHTSYCSSIMCFENGTFVTMW